MGTASGATRSIGAPVADKMCVLSSGLYLAKSAEAAMTKRAHVVLPEELVKEVDRVAGQRRRSRFIEVAIREKLSREVRSGALRASAGILDPADYPHWETPEKVSAWVRDRRADDNARVARKVGARAE